MGAGHWLGGGQLSKKAVGGAGGDTGRLLTLSGSAQGRSRQGVEDCPPPASLRDKGGLRQRPFVCWSPCGNSLPFSF